MGKYSKEIKKITGLDEQDFIKQWKTRDREFTTAMKHVEEHGLRCLRMLNGDLNEQWDKNLKASREEDGRPVLVENLLPDFINKPHGEFCQSTPSALVEPIDSAGTTAVAQVLKGLISHTSYNSQTASIHNDCFFNLLAATLTAWRVNTRFVSKDTFNVEPVVRQILNPFSVRWDLAAEEPDLSDKQWAMILDTLEEKEFKHEYGKDAWKPKDWEKTEGTSKEHWFAEKKATVAEVWWIQADEFTLYEQLDGTTSREKPSVEVDESGKELRSRTDFDLKVWSCVISPSEILTEPIEWPDYTDNPIIPVVVVHGRKLTIAGKIHYKGLISDALEVQKLHNYWITSITESIALQPDAPYLATDAQIAGYEEWEDLSKKVRAMRYKVDPKAPGPPIRQQPPQLSGAVLQMPQYTRQSMRDIIGLQQASLGITSNEKSGVAIQKRKQEGDAGKFSFLENMTRGIELEARIQINILPSIMDTPRIVRIVGPTGMRALASILTPDQEGRVLDLSVGKYEVAVTTGPTFSTQRDEARDMMAQLMQYLAPVAPVAVTAITPLFLRQVNSPDAERMAQIVIATLDPKLQAFYKEDDGLMRKIPPEIMNQIQAMQSQLMQMQQIAQSQAQQIESLKREEALKLKELASKEGIEQGKMDLERERIMKEITLKEMEIKSKEKLKLEELSASIELKMTELMETIKAQRELKMLSASLEKKAEAVETPTPVIGGQVEKEQTEAPASSSEESSAEPTD